MKTSPVKRGCSPRQRGWPVATRLARTTKGPFPRPRGDAPSALPMAAGLTLAGGSAGCQEAVNIDSK
jgi:hypothetical protein